MATSLLLPTECVELEEEVRYDAHTGWDVDVSLTLCVHADVQPRLETPSGPEASSLTSFPAAVAAGFAPLIPLDKINALWSDGFRLFVTGFTWSWGGGGQPE